MGKLKLKIVLYIRVTGIMISYFETLAFFAKSKIGLTLHERILSHCEKEGQPKKRSGFVIGITGSFASDLLTLGDSERSEKYDIRTKITIGSRKVGINLTN